ncbi:MAG TPA: peptide deformylase [Cytophagales bacterium]|nr:peptide deformylase [Cytophagales bacterium]
MIYPVVAYGDPVLKKTAVDVDNFDKALVDLIRDMYETMYDAHGVGLAAPQIGKSIRLFVVDASPFEDEDVKDFKKAFVNPEIIESSAEEEGFEEGCLSIPGIRREVKRPSRIKLRYSDETGKQYEEWFDGLKARIIQHEYDHIEGVLFIDRLSSLQKQLLKGKLSDISKGKVDIDYRMKFFKR